MISRAAVGCREGERQRRSELKINRPAVTLRALAGGQGMHALAAGGVEGRVLAGEDLFEE